MIPDFKTYLNESVWGDLRKKSLGQENRIENDIDRMDMPTFKEYLKERYIFLETSRECVELSRAEELYVYFFKQTGFNRTKYFLFWLYPEHGMITFSHSLPSECPEIYNALKNKFDVKNKIHDGFNLYVMESDKNTIKSFLIKVLDYLIDSGCENLLLKKRDINESVWGDLRKKSLGQEERIEDIIKIDDLDGPGLCKYINDRYECPLWEIKDNSNLNIISVPILSNGPNSGFSVAYDYIHKEVSMNFEIIENFSYLVDELRREYFTKTERVSDVFVMFIIAPADRSKPTNSFFLDVIEFLIFK